MSTQENINDINSTNNLPGNIVFIELPPSFAKKIGNFDIDPNILIPVELGKQSLSELSWEMIIAGMLRFLAYCPNDFRTTYYRKFINSVKPDIFNELLETGVINARNKNLDIAEEVFKALIALSPERPEPLLNYAVLSEDKAAEFDNAEKADLADIMRNRAFDYYKKLLMMEPPFPDAYFNAAFFYLKNHSYESAARLFETYIKIGNDEKKKSKASEILSKLKIRGDADNCFKEAFDFIKMGKNQEGLTKALDFTKNNPDIWNGWFLVGWANRRLKNWQDGRNAFLKALELESDEVDVLNELAICEMELGLLEESKKRLELALKKESDNIKIISNLGIVSAKQGKIEDAKGFFRTVLEFSPDDKIAKEQLNNLNRDN